MTKTSLFAPKTLLVIIIIAFSFFYLYEYRNNDPLHIGEESPNFYIETVAGERFDANNVQLPKAVIFLGKSSIYSSYYLKIISELKQLEKQGLLRIFVFVKTRQNKTTIIKMQTKKRFKLLEKITYIGNIKELSKDFGVRSWPHFFLLDKSNVVIYQSKLPSVDKIKAIVKGD